MDIRTNVDAKVIIEKIDKFVVDKDLKGINGALKELHPSVRYYVISEYTKYKEFNDIIKAERVKTQRGEYTNSMDKPYQMYQDLKKEAIDSNKHDNTPAKMIDVDRAITQAYVILVNMIGTINKTLNVQSEAINRIEERLGIDKTDFYGG